MNLRLVALIALLVIPLASAAMAIEECNSRKRVTCVVDGDTIWLEGEKIRLKGFDAPETTTNICGGQREVDLGKRATRRLVELMIQGGLTIQRDGEDRYQRTLANLYSNGVDVGDILISEGLARSWPDGDEFWCR